MSCTSVCILRGVVEYNEHIYIYMYIISSKGTNMILAKR